MQRKKIRVMIVEDSRLYQIYLRRVLELEPCLEVAGTAGSAAEAKSRVGIWKPDVITLDLSLPDVREFELLKYLLSHTKIPVIVVSSLPWACEEAIRLGASDFMEKIQDSSPSSAEQFAAVLRMKVKKQAKWIRQTALVKRSNGSGKRLLSHSGRQEPLTEGQMVIAVGASVGGTESTLEILRELPEDMPGIVIVQHMPPGFTKAYALRLNQNCRLQVSQARDGDRILPGHVLVAEGGKQMTVKQNERGLYVRCREGDKVSGFCPSVDVLFSSLAETNARGAGVILTGMGKDGVRGIGRLHEKGFLTLGQEKESCVVFGMPQAAWQAGALDELLRPEQIAGKLVEYAKNIQTGERPWKKKEY